MSKKPIYLLIALLVLLPSALLGAEEGNHKNAVSVDPIALIFNLYSGSYERAITEQFSVKATLAYSPNFFWVSDIGYFDFSGEGRFYFGSLLEPLAEKLPLGEKTKNKLFGKAISGLYVGAFLGGVTASVKEWVEDEEVEVPYTYNAGALGLGGGITLGAKYPLIGKKISFFAEPYVTLKYYALVGGDNGWTYTDTEGNEIPKPAGFDDGFSRSGFSFGVNAGISF